MFYYWKEGMNLDFNAQSTTAVISVPVPLLTVPARAVRSGLRDVAHSTATLTRDKETFDWGAVSKLSELL